MLNSLDFSPDGTLLAAFSGKGVRLWQVTNQQLAAQSGRRAFHGAFLPHSSNRLVIAEITAPSPPNPADTPPPSQLAFFDAALRQHGTAWPTEPFVLTTSGDGRFLAEGYGGMAGVWEIATGTARGCCSLPGTVTDLALAPDGSMLAACCFTNREVGLWSADGEPAGTLAGLEAAVLDLAFSPDGRRLATSGRDESVRVWDLATGTQVKQWLRRGTFARSLAFSPDGSLLATADADHSVRLWRLDAPPPQPGLTNVSPPLAFSPDSRLLAATRGTNGLAIWDLASRRLVAAWSLPAADWLAWEAATGPVLAASLHTNTPAVEVLSFPLSGEAPRSHCRLDAANSRTTCLALAPDGARFVSGHEDGSVRWWEGHSGQLVAQQPPCGAALQGAVFSRDGRRVVLWNSFSRVVQTWNALEPRLLAAKETPHRAWFAPAFSPDGEILATGGDLQTIRFCNAATLERQGALPEQRANVTHLAWSPRGKTLAAATLDGALRLWHVPTSRMLVLLWQGPAGTSQRITHLAFSPDGQWLAATDSAGHLHLWHGPELGSPALR